MTMTKKNAKNNTGDDSTGANSAMADAEANNTRNISMSDHDGASDGAVENGNNNDTGASGSNSGTEGTGTSNTSTSNSESENETTETANN